MPWLDEVNAVWRQVGREVGAAFELREYDPGASDIAFGAALVRRTERWDIALQYRAECEYAHSDAGDDFKTTTMMKAVAKTETAFRFNIGRDVWPDDWSIKIDGRRYGVEGNNKNKIRVLLDDQMIRSLIPTALGSSSLELRRSQLSFSEKSENQVPGAWKKVESYNWMLPIRDPGRLKALFRLFEAVLDRLEQLEVQEVAEIMTAQVLDSLKARGVEASLEGRHIVLAGQEVQKIQPTDLLDDARCPAKYLLSDARQGQDNGPYHSLVLSIEGRAKRRGFHWRRRMFEWEGRTSQGNRMERSLVEAIEKDTSLEEALLESRHQRVWIDATAGQNQVGIVTLPRS